MYFLIFHIRGITLFAPCPTGRSVLILKNGQKLVWKLRDGEEVAQLKMLEEDKQDQLFFNYWSVKESFLKYIGTGLARPLNSFIVSFSGEGVSLFEGGNKLPLYVHTCPVDDGYACHVCCEYGELTGIHEIFLEEITGC